MRNEDLLPSFANLSYSAQQLFIQQLRRGRELPSTNNVVKQRRAARSAEADATKLIESLTPEQITTLMNALGG